MRVQYNPLPDFQKVFTSSSHTYLDEEDEITQKSAASLRLSSLALIAVLSPAIMFFVLTKGIDAESSTQISASIPSPIWLLQGAFFLVMFVVGVAAFVKHLGFRAKQKEISDKLYE